MRLQSCRRCCFLNQLSPTLLPSHEQIYETAAEGAWRKRLLDRVVGEAAKDILFCDSLRQSTGAPDVHCTPLCTWHTAYTQP